MFIKLCGFAFVILSGGMMGLKLSKDYLSRISTLEEFKKIMNILKNEITYNNESILEAIRKSATIKDKSINAFFLEVVNIYEKEAVSIKEAWNKSADKMLKGNTSLKDSDIELIKQIGNNLGITCRATQIDNINHFVSKLDVLIEELIKPKNEKCKMYKTMGVMTGLLIVILFV